MALTGFIERPYRDDRHLETFVVLGLLASGSIPFIKGDFVGQTYQNGCDGDGVMERWAGGDAKGLPDGTLVFLLLPSTSFCDLRICVGEEVEELDEHCPQG